MSESAADLTATLAEGNIGRFLSAAHSPATMRAYRSDLRDFTAWCSASGAQCNPPSERTVGEYLADSAGRVAHSTLTRRVAAISYLCRNAGWHLNQSSPCIRDVLRGVRKTKNATPQKAAAFMPDDIRAMVATLGGDLAGMRDRAMILIGYAGALRRSELVGIEREHITETDRGISIFLPKSKEDQEGRGAAVEITRGHAAETCPVGALHAWLVATGTESGPVFRKVGPRGAISSTGLNPDAVRRIVGHAASAAGIAAPDGERVSPHGLRSGFVTAAFRAGASDEQIMRHTRHAGVSTMRGYVRRERLERLDASKVAGL